ncbi:DNA double-strand break repair protein Mre11 [Natronomonas pharaonis DSM 2160]|uniref:DNA double-strand break repair protein Mre11 n=1 Tax=Natronomonas pharaonis (strain ATCC 35678 / DSM 2160 / CIP 103997 / JCM 8858 / NBRC 14720 / NCIMB 2260 / Gabara) TaxID=348780 RepID=Q3ISN6_NATPD|nr:DNA double-strand break repair protein Mre11 [Natronomonas pharaonis]CAI48850.1 DNA double-strand break repair protein Mre11 [Natronomonas pharaonis DSM 2160]
MTRVLHTGDTHIGYRQYHTPERREDFLSAFRQVADDAVEMDVDAVVHAGDLFHDRRPGLVDLLGTVDILETLDSAGIPFLAIVGNHETKRDAQWLDLFETMGLATRLGDEPVPVGETAFYGLDFVPRNQRDDLEYEFATHDCEHAALVSHGLFEPLVPDYGNVEWDIEAVLEASNIDFDAVLLGDEHAATKQEVADTWVTYCGSTERTSASERDDRGYNLVTFDGAVRISRRGIKTRPFVFVDLELGATEGFNYVRDRLLEYDLDDAVVRVTLDGDGEDVSPARIESFATDEGALVARVTDNRTIDVDADAPDIAFADPDKAARERVRELGLSEMGRQLDETVRDGEIADSNLSDEIERRVESALEDGGLEDIAGTAADADTGDNGEAGDSGATTGSESERADGKTGPSDTGDAGETGDARTEAESNESSQTQETDGQPAENGQSSMEEYL